MNGFSVLLAKEVMEIRRTWRIWVVPGMLAFFAVTGPILALITPRLLASMASAQPGVVIHVPDPTAIDAYAQFLKGLSQIVLIALIIGGAGSISGERSTGTAILVLTKPASRAAFVLAKLVADLGLLMIATLVATGITFVETRALFPPLSATPLVASVALWLVQAGLIVSAVTFCSARFRSRGAAAGAALVFLLLMLLAAIWAPADRYTFVGLSSAMSAALRGAPHPVAMPVLTALAGMASFAAAAVLVFRRQEL